MCPQIDPYNAKTLEALKQAFDATWVVVEAREPFRDFERDFELKTPQSEAYDARCGWRDRSN
jgi:hypothetical protein